MFETTKLVGQSYDAEKANAALPTKRRASARRTNSEKGGHGNTAEKAIANMPPAGEGKPRRRKNTEMTGHINSVEKTISVMPVAQDEGHKNSTEKAGTRVPSPVQTLIELQKRRRFAIKCQSRIDRSTEAFLAFRAGYQPPKVKLEPTAEEKKHAKELFALVSRVRLAVEKADGQAPRAEKAIIPVPSAVIFPAWADPVVILAARDARITWDKMRADTEKQMESIVESLPIWQWAKGIKGLGRKGVGIIIGEAGDLSAYPSKGHLWKRLGLAVIDGERQQKKTGTEAAALHGYSPQRRAEMFVLTDALMQHQMRADRDEDGKDPKKSGKPVAIPAHPTGPYGELFYYRRACTSKREGWIPNHSKNDAARYMFKKLLAHMRAAWIAAQKSEA